MFLTGNVPVDIPKQVKGFEIINLERHTLFYKGCSGCGMDMNPEDDTYDSCSMPITVPCSNDKLAWQYIRKENDSSKN
jgi:hypothetical protein